MMMATMYAKTNNEQIEVDKFYENEYCKDIEMVHNDDKKKRKEEEIEKKKK
jgi:hypothetical protein